MNFRRLTSLIIVTLVFLSCRSANPDDKLLAKIEKIIANSEPDIGISITDSKTNRVVTINGDKHYPLLSTVKVPIALAVLNKVENGELSMKQEILVLQSELHENTWSPFKEKFPVGDTPISIEEALMWMIVYSDNNITDVLIRLAGGETAIEKYINDKDIIIKNNEVDMHKDWDSQFVNRASPKAYMNLLRVFTEGQLLNEVHTKWLYQAMVDSKTGVKRLKGKLPNVVIAQRAGTSFTNDKGITGAINNVGIMELPNDRKVYITVFIRDNANGLANGEEMIADIAQVVYKHYLKN